MSDIVHILHKDDRIDRKVKLLCGAENSYWWTYKEPDGAWIYNRLPTCQACVLLAMIEPESVLLKQWVIDHE